MNKTEEPEVWLSESTHQYYHKSGRELLSVTTAFERIGITDFSKVPFAVLEPARIKGDMVHEMAMYYGLGILDESSIDPALGGYLEGIKKFFRDCYGKFLAVEQPIYSLTHGYAGTPDIVYLDRSGIVRLDDYKTATYSHKACRWQTAAYAYAFEKMHKIKIEKRRGVHFTSNGSYIFDDHVNPLRRDFDEFLSILKVAILKINNKIK